MKKFLIIGIAAVLLLVTVPFVGVGVVVYEVFFGNYDHLKKERILEILSKETTVYYADGQTQLGSLFGSEHRQYVPLKQIPRHMLDAVVAAEDDGFYSHPGIDFLSTARALVRNLTTGHREGASTITQQTVKNLYGRPVTNYKAKFVEAINAFKIERVFSKDEILEFYLNQFHVVGNGRGVGVAAKYYFDKEVQELTLTEAAFLAGSVKWPARYNPFIKRSLEAQNRARADAKVRKNYVVRRMLETKFITKDVSEKARAEEVPFRQGKFQFNELFITEIVQRQMGREEVLKAIGAETIDQVGTMGLRITTTLERPIQNAAQYGVRQNLSRLEMILSGFQKENAANFVYIQRPEAFGFYVAKLVKLDATKKQESATLSFGTSECTVPTDAIDRVAKITDQAYYRGLEKSKALFLAALAEGDHLLASVRKEDETGKLICDIERRPRIQGALMVLDKGQIVAMVGGYSPNEYNRAIFAHRQPGSTFKALTFYPALQLGWNALDSLANARNVYSWQGQYYYPRPDHAPESLETSFVGANSKSENLASVYLLARLLDKLTFTQFRELLEHLDVYDDRTNEADFMRTLAGKFNVKFTEWNLKGGIFEALRSDLSQDLSIGNDPRLRSLLRTMNYGRGFDAELTRLSSGKGGKIPPKERTLRINLLRNTLLRWTRVGANARAAVGRLKAIVEQGDLVSGSDRTLLASLRLAEGGKRLAYVSPDTYLASVVSPLVSDPVLRSVTVEELIATVDANRAMLSEENMLLDGLLPLSLEREMSSQIESRYASVQAAPALEKLFLHDDFRYSLGMIYAQQMVRHMGIESEIQWVPSYPLGVNVVTLAELTLAYQTLLEGKTYRYFQHSSENQLVILKRVEDAQGNLLWEAESREHAFADSFYSGSMLSVLRGTVTNGTARAANKNVILRSNVKEEDDVLVKAGIRVPIFGKTGTTNDYTNATYVGYLPYPDRAGQKTLSAENAYTIAAYVGYDTNEPMVKRGFKVAGGVGALPAWIETALALIREQKFAEKMKWKDLVDDKVTEIPFDYGSETQRVAMPIHSSQVQSVASADGQDSGEKSDLNAGISDYARTGSEPLFVGGLPGQNTGQGFLPRTKVSFFKAAPVDRPTGELPPLPAALSELSAKGTAKDTAKDTATDAPKDGGIGVTARADDPAVPAKSGVDAISKPAEIPTETFAAGDDADFDMELPPMPAQLTPEAEQRAGAAPGAGTTGGSGSSSTTASPAQ